MHIANWCRMVTEFFLREINAHRCMRFNLSRGSASAMRRLRQEAGDLEEAPLPEQVVGDEEVAEQPEHEVDGDVGASPRTLRKNLTGMPCIGNGASSSQTDDPEDRPLCQCWCGCRRQPGRNRRQCWRCWKLVGPGCCWMGDNVGICHTCTPAATSRWEGCNLYLDLSQTQALDAMGLPDDGSDLSESFLDARRGAMRDNLSGAATPILTNALLANGVIDRWKKSWDPKKLEWKRKRRILETEERGRRRGAQDAATRK